MCRKHPPQLRPGPLVARRSSDTRSTTWRTVAPSRPRVSLYSSVARQCCTLVGLDEPHWCGEARDVFTTRLWVALGVCCLLAVLLGLLLVRDPFGFVIFCSAAATYLFTCFVLLTLLSFVPRPALIHPAGQVGVFFVALAASGLTAALAGAALGPLLGLPADFDFSFSYYLYTLPFFGLSLLAVALMHAVDFAQRRRRTRGASTQSSSD